MAIRATLLCFLLCGLLTLLPLVAGENPAPQPVPAPAPAVVDPDAVPSGEPPPWVPATPPPADNEGVVPAAVPPPAPAPVPVPAPVPNPTPVPAPSPTPPPLEDGSLDLHFLDFLVPKNPRPTWHLVGGMENIATAGVKSAGSRPTVGVTSTEIAFGYREWRVTYKRAMYDWDFNNVPVFGLQNGLPPPPASIGHGRDPWQPLTTLSLGYYKFSGYKPMWWIVWGGGVNASFEKELDQSFGVFGLFQFVHQFKNDWKINFGVILMITRQHILPLPVVGFAYHKDTKTGWSISIGFPEIILAYHFNEKFQVRTHFIEGEGDSYRLARDNPIAPNGRVEFKGAKTGLECEWNPVHDLSIVVGVKYLFSRQWIVHSATEHHKETINLNSAADFSIRAEWGF